ncbi:SfnB family sulfur acquisition oxidoreductase [Leucobacter celer]|jgi:SfnB family sulfur acquisition oxidoreductase|uniref:SfnB family sulfur acquisition oxidoreductase n=1 Tax=Leucobacter celer TaxID=668625 RepID=UPI0006A77DEA|nr:SfnB family sulfur acquisition oxidoreductase [Leucobacter celer]
MSSPAHVIRSDEEALAQAAEFRDSVLERAASIDADRVIPQDIVEDFSQRGLWAITVPKSHGGADVSLETVAEVIAIVGEADSSLAQIPQNHFCLVEDVRLSGTAEQQEFFFGLVLRGSRFANAFSELGGKNVGDLQTKLVRDGDEVVVNGRKFYSTGSIYADWIPVLAVDEDGLELLVFAEKNAPGLTVVNDWSSFGQRATASGSVVLEDLRLPASRVFPMYKEYDNPTLAGPLAQITTAAIDLGIARGAFRETLAATRASRPWIDAGVESATKDPLSLNIIGRLDIDIRAAEALTREAARAIDAAKPAPDEHNVAAASIAVARAKVLTTEVSLEASTRLLELGGTRSTLGEKRLDRFWRNARVHTLHDPVRWKNYAIGDYVLNGTLPARHSWL